MRKHNIIEKIIFGFGIIIILAILGHLSYQIYRPKKEPPQLAILSTYQPSMDNYGFEVAIQNRGEETAVNAHIKFILYQDGKALENVILDFGYIPAKSEEKGWIVFNSKRKTTDSLVVSSVAFGKE